MTPTEERNKFDASTYVDRAIAMLKDELVPGRINVAAYNGIVSLLQYAKESHAASLNRQGWTRVENGLPEVEDGHAIEVTICSHICDAEEPMVVASGVFYKGDFYLCAEWMGGDLELIKPLTPGRITHWMPLPNKPEPV